MSRDYESHTREHRPEPLHQVLLSFGKNWLQWSGSKSHQPTFRVRHVQVDKRYDLGDALIADRTREIAIAQLATSLRLQGIDDESMVMLDLLESLAMAGEISFRDYIGRVQNLFPRVLDHIDVTLRMRIVGLMVD